MFKQTSLSLCLCLMAVVSNCLLAAQDHPAAPQPSAPEISGRAPAGASVQCVDGSYSFSKDRRDECARHGGVSRRF